MTRRLENVLWVSLAIVAAIAVLVLLWGATAAVTS